MLVGKILISAPDEDSVDIWISSPDVSIACDCRDENECSLAKDYVLLHRFYLILVPTMKSASLKLWSIVFYKRR